MPNTTNKEIKKIPLVHYLYVLVVLVLFIGIGSIAAAPAAAFRMANDFFIITLGNFNSISGQISGSGNKLTFTSGEIAPGLFVGTNYKICAGFYGGIYCNATSTSSGSATPTFEFAVNPTTIDFGSIDPTNPVTRTNTLTVSASQPFTYIVTARENHTLQLSKNFIPDTTCDSGLCTDLTAAIWANTLTYGFGYRCDNVTGTDCTPDFTSSDFYKSFANAQLGNDAQIVLNGTTKTTGSSSQITYKVNVSVSQQPGTYTNTITYLAIPTF